MKKYLDALYTDFIYSDKFSFDTIYIGGGTPSLLPSDLLNEFLYKLFYKLESKPVEFTVEANPDSLSEDFLSTLSTYGLTRLSMGCQSSDNDVLKKLGRVHSYEIFIAAYNMVRQKFPQLSINTDLIYDIPQVSTEISIKTAEDLIMLSPEHISAYSYSNDTSCFDALNEEESSAKEFRIISDILLKNGYNKYEVSNFAKPGKESRHNINYWKLGDYVGIGASAWSLQERDNKRILRGKPADVNIYINSPLEFDETSVTQGGELIKESIVFGLRMTDGINLEQLQLKYGKIPKQLQNTINKLIKDGYLTCQNEMLKTTSKGELLLESLSESLWCS